MLCALLVRLGATFPDQLGPGDVCDRGVDFDPEILDDLIEAGMYLYIVRVERQVWYLDLMRILPRLELHTHAPCIRWRGDERTNVASRIMNCDYSHSFFHLFYPLDSSC